MKSKLQELIKQYNDSFKKDLEFLQNYISKLSISDFFKSLRDFGRTKTKNGKDRYSSHFKNNMWYNRKQKNNNGIEVQLRDVLIEKMKNEDVLNDKSITTFDKLYEKINQLVLELNNEGIKGASQMTKYDVACYIGFVKGLTPTKIYIHRGVRDGAKLLDLIVNEKKDYILEKKEVFEKCPELKRLGEANHIENFLCINKIQLKEFK